jgi:gluconolactonase
MLVGALILVPQTDFNSIKVTQLVTGYQFTEGCVWRAGALTFSDIPGNKILRKVGDQAATVLHEPSGNANGNVFDRSGNLISCLHGGRSVVRWKGGKAEIIADKYDGKKLNSPNDAAFGPRNDLYFTDPPYGIRPAENEQGFAGVYRVDAKGVVTLLDKSLNRPNGIAFSPDLKTAYVADTAGSSVTAYKVKSDGTFDIGTKLINNIQGPDGMRVDRQGNLYITARGGVHVYSSEGRVLGLISVPENPTNCAFGDRDMKTLFITAQRSVYSCRVPIAGKP